MKLKVDENGKPVFGPNGHPIYILDSGAEAEQDVGFMANKIQSLNGEAQTHRTQKEELANRLKGFTDAGIEDPAAAKAALETVSRLSAGELKTAQQVRDMQEAAQRTATEAVANATRAAEEREKALRTELDQTKGQLNNTLIGSAFNGSKYIKDKLAIPADMAQKFFQDNFKVENGQVIALDTDAAGNKVPMFSDVQHGQNAPFDEAISRHVAKYPGKDLILKGNNQAGSGSNPNGGNRLPNGVDLSKLSPAERLTAARQQAAGG